MNFDQNTIHDAGASRSISGINVIAKFFDVIEIKMHILPSREIYLHGWGMEVYGARKVFAFWELTVVDLHDQPCTFTFDFIEGDSPTVIGLDVVIVAVQNNMMKDHLS